jgi:hypothetical protein
MKLLAARLEAENPLWSVLFGVYSREFVAIPRFDGAQILTANYPAALVDRMRRTENAVLGAAA